MLKLLLGVALQLRGDVHVLSALQDLRIDNIGDDSLILAFQVLVQKVRQFLSRHRGLARVRFLICHRPILPLVAPTLTDGLARRRDAPYRFPRRLRRAMPHLSRTHRPPACITVCGMVKTRGPRCNGQTRCSIGLFAGRPPGGGCDVNRWDKASIGVRDRRRRSYRHTLLKPRFATADCNVGADARYDYDSSQNNKTFSHHRDSRGARRDRLLSRRRKIGRSCGARFAGFSRSSATSGFRRPMVQSTVIRSSIQRFIVKRVMAASHRVRSVCRKASSLPSNIRWQCHGSHSVTRYETQSKIYKRKWPQLGGVSSVLGIVDARASPVALKRLVHPTEQPAESECDPCGRVRLVFNDIPYHRFQ